MIRINAVRFAQKNRTGQPWDKPGHPRRAKDRLVIAHPTAKFQN